MTKLLALLLEANPPFVISIFEMIACLYGEIRRCVYNWARGCPREITLSKIFHLLKRKIRFPFLQSLLQDLHGTQVHLGERGGNRV